jgi:predicted RNA-binding Zn-ribbon protein involved in translation (DUF1610 family)
MVDLSMKCGLREILKWSATLSLFVAVAAWVLSGEYEFGMNLGNRCIALEGGALGMTGTRSRPHIWSHQRLGMWAYWVPVIRTQKTQVVLILPLWCVVCALGMPAIGLWYADWQRRKRRRPGHCSRCGYDLTGNVSGRCPECGGPVWRTDALATRQTRESEAGRNSA